MAAVRLTRLAVLLVLAVAVGCAPAAPDGPAPAARGTAEAGRLRIVSSMTLSDRAVDLVLDSPSVGPLVPVRLLLPARYRAEPNRRWPVLYLLHGCCDGYRAWTRSTDVEQLSADADVLVVMPDGGPAGFYSDWRTGPRWESFHLVELWGLLHEDFRAGDRAAIAGLSMGGLGALAYAARHPGMFRATASFSGMVHTRLDQRESQYCRDLVREQGEDPQALWGDPVADADTWAAHNPFDLAPRLAGVPLYLSVGDGRPGPLDPAGTATDQGEAALGRQNAALAAELRRLGLPAEIDFYGPGTHSWPYWERGLHRAWPMLTRALAP